MMPAFFVLFCFEKRVEATDFEGVNPICRRIGQLSLQVGKKNMRIL
jgi:hypothetical protein